MNWREQKGPLSGGKQSTATGLLILFLASVYFSKNTGVDLMAMLPDSLQRVMSVETHEGNVKPSIAEELPKYAITKTNIIAYNGYKNSNKVSDIPAGTKLKIKDYYKGKDGTIVWLQVEVVGLTVWIENKEKELKLEF